MLGVYYLSVGHSCSETYVCLVFLFVSFYLCDMELASLKNTSYCLNTFKLKDTIIKMIPNTWQNLRRKKDFFWKYFFKNSESNGHSV